MKDRTRNILVIGLSVLLVVVYMAAGTYSVIVDVVKENGVTEIVREIDVRDLLTDDNGNYNQYYYNTINTLNITGEEANILMDSKSINKYFKEVLDNIVDVKINNGTKYTSNQIYNLIVAAVNEDNNISNSLREKVINKSYIYINDILDYIYDVEVNVLNG